MKTTKQTRLFVTMLVITLLIILTGCETYDNFKKAFIDPPVEQKLTIRIGVLEPLTGRQSYDAEDELLGMKIAHKLFPSVNGYDIELVYKDNRSSTDEAKEAAKALIKENCAGILGSNSASLSLAVSDIVKENRIPAVSATNTVPILTSTNPYYFRVCYTNDYDAQGAAHYILEAIPDENGEIGNVSRAAVIVSQNNDFALGKAELFKTEFYTELGINEADEVETTQSAINEDGTVTEIVVPPKKHVEIYTLTSDETQLIEMLSNISSEFGDDAPIYFPSDIDSALSVITKAVESGYEFTFIGTENWEGIEQNNRVVEGISRKELLRNLAQTEVSTGPVIAEMPTETMERMLLDKVVYTTDYNKGERQNETAFKLSLYYKDETKTDDAPSENVALGFDAYMLMYRALESIEYLEAKALPSDKGGNDDTIPLYNSEGKANGDVLANAIYDIANMEGASGIISMNKSGDPIKDIYIRGITGNETKTIYTARPNIE